MRAPRCVSAFPITNLKRRRLRQSSYPSPPLPFFSSSPPPRSFSIFISRARSSLFSIPSSPSLPRSHGCVPVAARNCSCISQTRKEKKKAKERKGKEREEKKRKEKGRKGKKRGTEELGAQVRSKEWKGDWGRREDDRKTRRKFESDSFRPVKPITVFAGLITRNRVNCKLTRLVLPTKRGETTFENLKRQLDRLSRRSTDVPLEIR